MLLLGDAEVRCPFAVHEDFVDIDLIVQCVVDYFAGVDLGARWEFVDWVMRGEGIFAVLVDEEAGMDWEGMPGAEVDEVEAGWSGAVSIFSIYLTGLRRVIYIRPPTI